MKEGEVAVKADHTPTSQRGMRLRWQRRESGRLEWMLEKREKEEKRRGCEKLDDYEVGVLQGILQGSECRQAD